MTKEMTMEELSKVLYQTQVAKCILANQHALELNERLTRTPQYKHKLKQLGQPFIKELIKCHKSEFLKVEHAEMTLPEFKDQGVIDVAFERSENIISLLTKMAFCDPEELTEVLYAFALDKSSVLGISRKVNKKSKRNVGA